MGKIWVPAYPDASQKFEMYQQVISELQKYALTIKEATSMNFPSIDSLLDQTDTLTGNYYDSYVEHVSMFRSKAEGFINDLALFEETLNKRIESARQQRDLWGGRISLGHYEYESENNEQ